MTCHTKPQKSNKYDVISIQTAVSVKVILHSVFENKFLIPHNTSAEKSYTLNAERTRSSRRSTNLTLSPAMTLAPWVTLWLVKGRSTGTQETIQKLINFLLRKKKSIFLCQISLRLFHSGQHLNSQA